MPRRSSHALQTGCRRVTKKVNNFSHLMRLARTAGSVFRAIDQASITQIEDPKNGVCPPFDPYNKASPKRNFLTKSA